MFGGQGSVRAATPGVLGSAALGIFSIYLLALGARPLFLPDEYRYAEIAREMIASGDWIVPRMNGLVYFEKPVLGHWLNAASQLVLGESRFAVRLPAALACGLTAFLVFMLTLHGGTRRDPHAPALAAVVFLSSLGTATFGTAAILDNPFTAFLTATLASFFVAQAAPKASRRETGWLVLSGAFAGMAFLTKGFLAFVVPALTLGVFLVWQRRARDLLRMAWLPAVTAAAVVLPWAALIQLREPEFWGYFVWNEHIRRFLADDAQHARPWWYFLATAPLLLLPWSFVARAARRGWSRAARSGARDLIRFCLCWLIVPFLFFSASSGKLLTYLLPLLPPAAVLVALGLGESLREAHTRSLRAGLAALAAASSVLFILLSLALPDQLPERRFPEHFLRDHEAALASSPLLLSDSDAARAVCFVLRRDDVTLVGTRGEFAFGVEHDAAARRVLDLTDAARLIEENAGRLTLIAATRKYAHWKPHLPAPCEEVSNGPGGWVIARY